jgi:hypothetical protein
VSRLTDRIAQNLVDAQVNVNRLVFAVNQEMEGYRQDLGHLLECTTEAIADLMIANQRFTQLAKRQLAEKKAAKKKARRKSGPDPFATEGEEAEAADQALNEAGQRETDEINQGAYYENAVDRAISDADAAELQEGGR